jgi:ribosomal protein L34E
MPKLKLKSLRAIRKKLPGGLSILYFTKRNPGNPRKSKKGKGK